MDILGKREPPKKIRPEIDDCYNKTVIYIIVSYTLLFYLFNSREDKLYYIIKGKRIEDELYNKIKGKRIMDQFNIIYNYIIDF